MEAAMIMMSCEKCLLCEACCFQLLSRVQLFASPWTVAVQAPLSMGFSRQEYWNGLLFPSPGDLPDAGIKRASPGRRILSHWATWEALCEACVIPLMVTATLWERHYGPHFTDEKAEYQRRVVGRRQNSNPGPTPKSVMVPLSVVYKVGSLYSRGGREDKPLEHSGKLDLSFHVVLTYPSL